MRRTQRTQDGVIEATFVQQTIVIIIAVVKNSTALGRYGAIATPSGAIVVGGVGVRGRSGGVEGTFGAFSVTSMMMRRR